ncbi:hypothetical protein RM545_02375 [Zunongwangia sp. F260]|uniref:Uncharacterized protein n=1 Tax=Autumnicola lenta TaxID=3075593 RepID=A0ABU3CGQ8_9FLAO|nr:hypothetical protein [Zunongwangia sp. F260]MDT0645524.1 hypothetical protein [Zunongwangia sp. F260]
MTKSQYLFIFSITLLSNQIFSQEKDSGTIQEATKQIKAEFPRTRILNFEYGQSLSRDFKSELFDEDFQEGEIKNQKTFNASLNLPFYYTKKIVLTASANYAFNEFEFQDLKNTSTTTIFEQNGIVGFHNFRGAVSGTYFSQLFGKPVIYNASVIVDGNDNGFERLKGLVGASLIMKRTERTTITLGAIAFLDPTTQIPFFPTFTYKHNFKNSPWEFDFILPQRLLFRRYIGEDSRLSLGSTFGGNGFYVNVNDPNFPDVFEYSQLEINSGLIYEYRLSDYTITTFKGGITNFISNRLTEKGEPTGDYIYSNEQDPTGYFNVGFSIDPFAGKKK